MALGKHKKTRAYGVGKTQKDQSIWCWKNTKRPEHMALEIQVLDWDRHKKCVKSSNTNVNI